MPIKNSYVTDVNVSSFVKQHKNYAYALQTTWSDGMQFELYRRYGDFFTFQDLLLKTFPKEAGKYDSRERKIPYLPTVDNVFKLFGRTNSESVMQQRLSTINYYCQTVLLKLGDHISRSSVVIDFFNPTPNDKQMRRLGRPATLHPQKIPTGNKWENYVLLADYEAESGKSQQLSAKANDVVFVMRNDDSGWSLCTMVSTNKVGWLPTNYLKKKADDDDEEIELGFAASVSRPESIIEEDCLEKYRSVCEFTSEEPGQISFPEGAIIKIVDKDEDGWWFVSYNEKEGWAPSSYLEPDNGLPSITADELDEVYVLEQEEISDVSSSTTKNEIFYAKRDYQAELEDELSFTKGAEIEVTNKSISGWWTGRYNGKLGVVAATYLSVEPVATSVVENGQQNYQKEEGPSTPKSKAVSFSQSDDISNDKVSPLKGAKYDRPPPRRKTVRHTVMLQKNRKK